LSANQQFIDEPGLEGTSDLDPDLRADFLNGATGSLAFGQSRTLKVSPPIRVQSTDGSLEVTVNGQSHGAMGQTGQPAQDIYTAR